MEDFSGAKGLLDGLRANGVSDFAQHLDVHPHIVAGSMARVGAAEGRQMRFRLQCSIDTNNAAHAGNAARGVHPPAAEEAPRLSTAIGVATFGAGDTFRQADRQMYADKARRATA